MAAQIRHFRELDVHKLAMEAAMEIFELTKRFPAEERYSMTDQVRRSSRSVCANIGEAWRKRRYPASFISNLTDAEAESTETQVWLEMALRCGYLDSDKSKLLDQQYDYILGKLVTMHTHPDQWTIHTIREEESDYA